MSENKKLALMCFGIIGAITLSLETCAYVDRVQERQRIDTGKKQIQEVLRGPEVAQTTLTTREGLEIPSTVRVIRTERVGKYRHRIIIEGSKGEVIEFLSQYYGLNGQRD